MHDTFSENNEHCTMYISSSELCYMQEKPDGWAFILGEKQAALFKIC